MAVEFNVIEHVETHSLATIQTRSMPFDATLEPKEKFRDVRVESGEQLTLISGHAAQSSACRGPNRSAPQTLAPRAPRQDRAAKAAARVEASSPILY